MLLAGCDHGKRRTEPTPPPQKQSFLALDAQHQRLVGDYQPVSRALTAYELAYRGLESGEDREARLPRPRSCFPPGRCFLAGTVRRDPVTGEGRAKRLLVAGLGARATALVPPSLDRYGPAWQLSVVDARRALTILQDIRDRARLIPLPEDSVS